MARSCFASPTPVFQVLLPNRLLQVTSRRDIALTPGPPQSVPLGAVGWFRAEESIEIQLMGPPPLPAAPYSTEVAPKELLEAASEAQRCRGPLSSLQPTANPITPQSASLPGGTPSQIPTSAEAK